MKFSELGLSEKVLDAVEASGYNTPTPIQEQAIPHVLAGRDVLGIAQTGTGKTAAFTLPMMSRLERGPRPRAHAAHADPRADARTCRAGRGGFAKYGVNHKLNVALLIGGVSFGDQETKLTRGVDVLIATPGRLLDSLRARQAAADRHRNPGHRRSRPHARHGLHSRHRAHLQAGAVHAPDAVLLGHHAAGNHPPHRALPAQSGAHRGGPRRPRPPTTSRRRSSPPASSPAKSATTLRRLIRGAENFKNAIIFCNRKSDVESSTAR